MLAFFSHRTSRMKEKKNHHLSTCVRESICCAIFTQSTESIAMRRSDQKKKQQNNLTACPSAEPKSRRPNIYIESVILLSLTILKPWRRQEQAWQWHLFCLRLVQSFPQPEPFRQNTERLSPPEEQRPSLLRWHNHRRHPWPQWTPPPDPVRPSSKTASRRPLLRPSWRSKTPRTDKNPTRATLRSSLFRRPSREPDWWDGTVPLTRPCRNPTDLSDSTRWKLVQQRRHPNGKRIRTLRPRQSARVGTGEANAIDSIRTPVGENVLCRISSFLK